jgi:hypothetical protein
MENCNGKSEASSDHNLVANKKVVDIAVPKAGLMLSTPPTGGEFMRMVTDERASRLCVAPEA